MPQIIPNQRFLHDRDAYEEGTAYEVSPELAFYFKMCGWVGDKQDAQPVTLEIQDSEIGHKAEVK